MITHDEARALALALDGAVEADHHVSRELLADLLADAWERRAAPTRRGDSG